MVVDEADIFGPCSSFAYGCGGSGFFKRGECAKRGGEVYTAVGG